MHTHYTRLRTFGSPMLISWHGKLEFNMNSAPFGLITGSFDRMLLSSLSPRTIRLHRRTLSFGNVANLFFILRSIQCKMKIKERKKTNGGRMGRMWGDRNRKQKKKKTNQMICSNCSYNLRHTNFIHCE